MAVLARRELEDRMFGDLRKNPDKRLVITPLLDRKKQIGDASVDVRLSNEFIMIRHTNIPSINPTRQKEIREEIGKYQERVRVSLREQFVLHPHQLVLGCTLEYVAVPTDVIAQVEGRSSWGRLGLIIATATTVAPGFRGVITLELVNGGLAPLILYPGFRIAQLVFQHTSSKAKYKGRYDYPTGPQFSRIHEDKDMVFWGKR
jgi:dCTP deaminase